MKSDNQSQSSKQRLVTFLNNVCPQKIAENDNDNPIEKSRWAKWQFIKSGTGNKLEFHQLKKSESKIINRLLDRLDPWAGKARHAARIEIIELLENNGIVITDNIKKHLPDSRKLGVSMRWVRVFKMQFRKKTSSYQKILRNSKT